MDSEPQKEKQKKQEQGSSKLSEAQIKETVVPLVAKSIQSISVSETFSSIYPHPEHLHEYEKYCPGFLERIVSLSEKEQADYVEAVAVEENNDFALKMASLRTISLIATLCIVGAIFLIYSDKDIGGYALILGAVASVIYSIWNNKEKKKKSDQVKT